MVDRQRPRLTRSIGIPPRNWFDSGWEDEHVDESYSVRQCTVVVAALCWYVFGWKLAVGPIACAAAPLLYPPAQNWLCAFVSGHQRFESSEPTAACRARATLPARALGAEFASSRTPSRPVARR